MASPSSSQQGFSYPTGHLGHLSEAQLSTFRQFRQICQDRGVYTSATRPSHNDATLLRFLRARKFDIEPAFKQFQDTETWRKRNAIEELYDSIDIDEYDETRRLYPQWTGRRDKRGFPVYVFEVGNLDTSSIDKYEHSSSLKGIDRSFEAPVKMLRLFALYENLVRFVSPWCTANSSRPYAVTTPITQGINIIDVSGLGLRHFWSLKSHLQDSSQLATAHYPETLDKIFIIGAPVFFPTIWDWVKRWFDPIVVSKMFILSPNQVLPKMSEFIDPKDIPKKYGGQLEWNFGEMPKVDEEMWELAEEAPTEGLPIGPIKWIESQDGKLRMVAVGSQNGERRQVTLAKVDVPYARVFLQSAEGEDGKAEAKVEVEGSTREGTQAARTSSGPPVEAVAK